MYLCTVACFLLYCLTHIVIANTTTRDRATRAAITACRTFHSTTSQPDLECWERLRVDIWMSNWNVNTTRCGATQDLVEPCQCMFEEAWATCFMRLTFEGNRSADYYCTDVTMPENCTEPLPGHVVQGPAEIYYGAYAIWNLVQYLGNWNTALTAASAIPAIETTLKNPNSAASANTLLTALMNQYGIDGILFSYLNAILTESVQDAGNQVRPTPANAQVLLVELLQSTLEAITSDWGSGDFMLLSGSGMLLNDTGETSQILTGRLSQQ